MSDFQKKIFKSGEGVSIVCYSSYTLVNSDTKCQPDRSWGPTPSCALNLCQLPSIDNGYFVMNGNQLSGPQSAASVIQLHCNNGFTSSSNFTELRCLGNGLWDVTTLNCMPITCTRLPSIDNGQYAVIGEPQTSPYKYNQSIVLQCNPGYDTNGLNGPRQCTEINTWSGIDQNCFAITCDHPNGFTYGRYNENKATYYYGNVLEPSCDEGYFISNNVTRRVCVKQDEWSGDEPLCDRIKCKQPTILNAHLDYENDVYDYNTSITIRCLEGFEITDGSYTRRCQKDRTWGSKPLQCVKILCNDTTNITHQAISNSNYPHLGFNETELVLYNSSFFFLQSGSNQVICSANRKLNWISKPFFG